MVAPVGSLVRLDTGERLFFHANPPQMLRIGGVGGWEERPHPRQKASSEWAGTGLHKLPIQLWFDQRLYARTRGGPGNSDSTRPAGRSIQEEVNRLHQMGGPGGHGPPPIVRLEPWGYGLDWTVNDITPTVLRRDPTGVSLDPVHGRFDVDLLEHPRRASSLTAVERRAAVELDSAPLGGSDPQRAGFGRTYTVKAGDTLRRIALEQLGDAERWKDVYAANRAEIGGNPDLIQVGMVLALPNRTRPRPERTSAPNAGPR